MDKLPLVTIGVASYNNGRFITETLDSIKNQTYPNIELIVVDDFSKDNSIQIIEGWIAKNNLNIKFIKNQSNLGITKVSNILLNNASGKYFAILGSDDIYLENKVEIQVGAFEIADKDVAVIYSDVFVINENGELQNGTFLLNNDFDIRNLPSGNVFTLLAHQSFIPAMSVLCRRDYLLIVGGYDENLAYEDLDMWLKISLRYKIICSPFISAKYRVHSKSSWNTRGLLFQLSDIRIMTKYLNYNQEVDLIFKKRLAYAIEDVYRKHGRKFLKLLFINWKVNKSIKSFILLSAGVLNINFSALDKMNDFLKRKVLRAKSSLLK